MSTPARQRQTATALRETGTPTLLDLGDVADGEFLKRSGTTIIGGGTVGSPVSVVAADSPVTVANVNQVLICNTTAGAITLNLPTSTAGRVITIKRTSAGANALTVDGYSSQTIDGATTAVLQQQYEAITIYADGSNWHII